jgi:UDP-N-acetylglucosamine 4,6-dehydratase (inverting)
MLITGGTGSFGQAYVKRLLDQGTFSKIIVLSRDEMKQWEMENNLRDERLRFFIGDVRDKERLNRAFAGGVTHVVHAAATKIVPTAEYNPFEAVKTNILGATNVIDAAIDNGVKKVVALSTDKASSPINLYGATKLVSDKLFIAANNYSGVTGTRFGVVRYGNVMGSRGSLIPFLLSLGKKDKVPLTDKRMTRFMITLDQGVDLVETAFSEMVGGEIFVRKIPSMDVTEIIEAVLPGREVEVTGIRPGEKLHEQMIGQEDDRFTFDFGDHFRIYPAAIYGMDRYEGHGGKSVQPGFSYTSDQNDTWMSVEELRSWLKNFRAG